MSRGARRARHSLDAAFVPAVFNAPPKTDVALTPQSVRDSFTSRSGNGPRGGTSMKDIFRLEMPMSSGRRWRRWGLALLLAWSSLGLARVAMADGEVGCPPTPPDQKGKDNTICFN